MQLTALWESPCSRERWLKRIYRAGSAESGPVHVDRRTPAVAARPSRQAAETRPPRLVCVAKSLLKADPRQPMPPPAPAGAGNGGPSFRRCPEDYTAASVTPGGAPELSMVRNPS